MNSNSAPSHSNQTGQGLSPADLPGLITGFLGARGFSVEQPQLGLYIGRGAGAEPIAVLAPQIVGDLASDAPLSIEALESLLLDATRLGATRRLPIVTTSKKGIGPAEQSRITKLNGSPLYPLQFVDWYFRASQADEDATPLNSRLRDVIEENMIRARGPQPYRRLRDLNPDPDADLDGRDLLETLRGAMSSFPTGPRLRVVSGHAGVGKTVLVAALLDALQRNFNDAKRRANALASRPLLFEPTELGSRDEETLDNLIESLYASKLADKVPAPAFRWLAEQGYTTWIFDGLDEFYRRQNGFFEALEQMLDTPGGRTQIVICTRDSLLSSADTLMSFLSARLASHPDQIELYELAKWDAEAKRDFVTTLLRADRVREVALERRVNELIGALQADSNLAALTNLPFYCDLFVSALQDGRAKSLSDEFTLLQYAIDALINRESGKLSIDWDVFVSDKDLDQAQAFAAGATKRGLLATGDNLFAEALRRYGQDNLEYLLGGAAHFYRFAASDARALNDVSVAEWREVLSPSFIDAHLDDATEEKVQLALMQFAFFGRGRAEDGGQTISFVHDLIADYLAAKYAFSLIEGAADQPQAWRQAIGQRSDLEHTVFFRYLAAQFRANPALAEIGRAHLSHPLVTDPARRVLQNLLAAA